MFKLYDYLSFSEKNLLFLISVGKDTADFRDTKVFSPT